jgi:serine/threonine protein kinase
MAAMLPQPFGRYLLVEPRGEGGMAQVYRAVLRDVSGFEKQVALKRVHRDLCTDPDFIARFIDEARIVSAISHSNIVQVFDFGQVDGEYYLAMELVDGPDLGSFLEGCRRWSQPVPIPAAIQIAGRIARGLGAAHARRDARGLPAPVVHRDVSPQNVLLSRDGEVKVVDFGIAIAAERAFRTRTGVVVGKCRYMSPEQARGEPLDSRTDIFALGALLYEILAGQPLFDGATPPEVLQKVLAAPIQPITELNPEVPPELEEILLRALARAREARPPDGGALARELESLLHRIAPEYSRDDLAALIRVVTPARPPRSWDAVATQPDAALLDTQDGGELARDTEPTPPAELETPVPAAVVATPIPFASFSVAPAPRVAAVEPGGAAGDRSATLLGPVPARPRGRSRRTLALLAVALAGLCLGGAGRMLADREPPPARITIPRGGSVEQGGWRIAIERVERRADATLVHALASRRGAAVATGAGFALLSRSGPRPARFWVPTPRGTLLVFEPLPPRDPLVLRLETPGADPIELALVDGR